MKLETLKEAKYAGKKNISNLLTFFEEQPNEVMEHQTFYLRQGLVCYFFEDEIHTIENRNGTYSVFISQAQGPRTSVRKSINDENIGAFNVHELRKVF